MSYEAIETSAFEGNPVELYKFVKGTAEFYQTSSNEEITYDGNLYVPKPIKRDEVALTGEINKSSLGISVTKNNEVAQLFIQSFPSTVVTLTIFRLHVSDGNAILLWRGRVNSCSFFENSAKFTCESIFTSIKRTGLYRNYQKSCPHMLYDVACKAQKLASYGTVDTANGITITSSLFASQADGWWIGGIFESGNEQRYIHTHVGNTITIDRTIVGLNQGAALSVLPGCDRLKSTCETKFNNVNNYGGFPYIPSNNPFGNQGIL